MYEESEGCGYEKDEPCIVAVVVVVVISVLLFLNVHHELEFALVLLALPEAFLEPAQPQPAPLIAATTDSIISVAATGIVCVRRPRKQTITARPAKSAWTCVHASNRNCLASLGGQIN